MSYTKHFSFLILSLKTSINTNFSLLQTQVHPQTNVAAVLPCSNVTGALVGQRSTGIRARTTPTATGCRSVAATDADAPV